MLELVRLELGQPEPAGWTPDTPSPGQISGPLQTSARLHFHATGTSRQLLLPGGGRSLPCLAPGPEAGMGTEGRGTQPRSAPWEA